MATHSVPPARETPDQDPPEKKLTADEGWDLIFSLFGSANQMYAEVGGSEAWMRSERAAWANKDAGR